MASLLWETTVSVYQWGTALVCLTQALMQWPIGPTLLMIWPLRTHFCPLASLSTLVLLLGIFLFSFLLTSFLAYQLCSQIAKPKMFCYSWMSLNKWHFFLWLIGFGNMMHFAFFKSFSKVPLCQMWTLQQHILPKLKAFPETFSYSSLSSYLCLALILV